jgi:hypothetical protein
MILSISFCFFYNIIKIFYPPCLSYLQLAAGSFIDHPVRARFAYFESKRVTDVEKKKSMCYGPNHFQEPSEAHF